VTFWAWVAPRRRYQDHSNMASGDAAMGLLATEFHSDLAGRLANRVQLTTDVSGYLKAVVGAFGEDIDYSIPSHKLYGATPTVKRGYSPAVCTGCDKKPMIGNPDADHISTSYVERPEPYDAPCPMRRFTRLTNAFSKEN